MLLVSTVLLACGGDSTGPGDQASGVTGTWSYQASQMEGSGEEHGGSCSVTSGTLTLNQDGTSVTGSAQGLAVSCVIEGEQEQFMAEGPISAGVVENGEIAFNFGSGWRHAGTVSGNAMSGTTEFDITVNGDSFTLEGTWTAERQGATGPAYSRQ